MWWGLEDDIVAACNARIRKFERHQKRVFDENTRRSRRSTTTPAELAAQRPELWNLSAAHDPFHVRPRAHSFAHAIGNSMRKGCYRPHRPGGFSVAKSDGKSRVVSSFAIADEVISSRLYRSLLNKNRARFSARSYAYRDDIGVYDALAHIQSEWIGEQRIFIAEYDFRDFFESISHEHIWRTADALGLVMTGLERRLIESFLTSPDPYTNPSEKSTPAIARDKGVLQGTSISLLLANVAASPLDRALERLGVSFVRYADDTLIWSRDYSAICRAVDELHTVSSAIGAPINQEKSMGVRLLVPDTTTRAELPFTSKVDYLSHSIGLRTMHLKESAEAEIRKNINRLLFNNLIREPLNKTQNPARIGSSDKDYTSYIWQLRRYLYGHLNENEVRRLGRSTIPPIPLSGAVARFPLITDDDSLRELDRWISTQTWLALRRRSSLLRRSMSLNGAPDLWSLSREELINATSVSSSTGSPVDLRLPSVLRMSTVVRKAVRTHGTGVIGLGASLYGTR